MNAKVIFSGIHVFFSCSNVALLTLCPECIPWRDFAAWVVGLCGVLFAVIIFPYDPDEVLLSREFQQNIHRLGLLDIIFAIMVPWCIILAESFGRTGSMEDRPKSGFVLASHLFIFQAQIALEAIIFLSGGRRRLIFPYTCAANAYRTVCLVTWWTRVVGDESFKRSIFGTGIMYVLPTIATFFWFYTTFIFIPFIWYPLISSGRKKHLEKQS